MTRDDLIELRAWAVEKALECGRFGDCVGAARDIVSFVTGEPQEITLVETEAHHGR